MLPRILERRQGRVIGSGDAQGDRDLAPVEAQVGVFDRDEVLEEGWIFSRAWPNHVDEEIGFGLEPGSVALGRPYEGQRVGRQNDRGPHQRDPAGRQTGQGEKILVHRTRRIRNGSKNCTQGF